MRHSIKNSVFMSIAFVLYGCAAPQYDGKADTAIGDLQSKIHGQIAGWISNAKPATYVKNKEFYDQIDTDLKSLEIRMEATPDRSTANLPVYFANLNSEILILKDLHKKHDALSEPFLRATQQDIDSQFAALLTYELSLKTGSGATQSTATAQNQSAGGDKTDNKVSQK